MQLICLTNAYGMIHTRKCKWFTNAGSDLCVTFEDPQARATIHAQKRCSLTTHQTILQMCIPIPEWIFIIYRHCITFSLQTGSLSLSKSFLCIQMPNNIFDITLTHLQNLKYLCRNLLIHTDHIACPNGVLRQISCCQLHTDPQM